VRTKWANRLRGLPRSSFATTGARVDDLVRSGEDVINLCQGNPDLPTPGLLELKDAISAWYATRHGVRLDPETEVAILFGAKAGLVEISQRFLNPGDVCLMPDPAFPDYWAGVVLAQARMHPSHSCGKTASCPTTPPSTRPRANGPS
jgi:aminotransferase